MRQLTVFSFTELNEEAKKEAVEQYRSRYSDRLFDECDCEMLKEYFEEELHGLGYEDMKVYFSLSYCQGDGVAFEGELIEINKVAKRLLNEKEWALYEKLIEDNGVWGKIRLTNHGYYHWNSMDVEIESDIDNFYDWEIEEIGQELYKAYIDLLKDLQNYMNSDIKDISKRLEKEGYEDIEYKESDEYIIETLENNDHIEFYEDGTIF